VIFETGKKEGHEPKEKRCQPPQPADEVKNSSSSLNSGKFINQTAYVNSRVLKISHHSDIYSRYNKVIKARTPNWEMGITKTSRRIIKIELNGVAIRLFHANSG